jgi:hypothetical protein
MQMTGQTMSYNTDGIWAVTAYQMLLSFGFIMGGVFIVSANLGMAWEMAQRDSLFQAGLVALVMMMIFSLLLGSAALIGSWALATLRPWGRSLSLMFHLLLIILSLLSIPVLLFSYGAWDSTLVMLLVISGMLIALSGASVYYLRRPAIRSIYQLSLTSALTSG